MSEKIKIIIVDDSDFVRDGMNIILGLDDDFEVLGLAADGMQAVSLARQHKADIILMDIRMPVMDGIEATEIIVREDLGKVLILTTFDDDDLVVRAIRCGAKGYLIKNHTPEKLKQMIKSVHAGVNILEETIWEKLTDSAVLKGNMDFSADLFTSRELMVIKAIAEGLSNKEIAAQLFLSEGTVKNHISVILEKAELKHRTQVAIYYLTGKR